MQVVRLAASRTRCTAGIRRAIRMAMMAMTTRSSTRVNALRRDGRDMGPPWLLRPVDSFTGSLEQLVEPEAALAGAAPGRRRQLQLDLLEAARGRALEDQEPAGAAALHRRRQLGGERGLRVEHGL